QGGGDRSDRAGQLLPGRGQLGHGGRGEVRVAGRTVQQQVAGVGPGRGGGGGQEAPDPGRQPAQDRGAQRPDRGHQGLVGGVDPAGGGPQGHVGSVRAGPVGQP